MILATISPIGSLREPLLESYATSDLTAPSRRLTGHGLESRENCTQTLTTLQITLVSIKTKIPRTPSGCTVIRATCRSS
eukprot:906682-Amphidinium_carterae.1